MSLSESKTGCEIILTRNPLLIKYFANPNPLVTLIFTSNEVPDKRKQIFKTISEKENYIALNPFNKKEMVYECIILLSFAI